MLDADNDQATSARGAGSAAAAPLLLLLRASEEMVEDAREVTRSRADVEHTRVGTVAQEW